MSEPTEIQILAALEQSGYLFEQEVADKLEDLGFHVDTGWAFQDPEQEKSRELDVRGIKCVFHDEQNKLSVFVELLVECKAYENPLVFLQRAKNKREMEHPEPREYLFPVKHFKKPISANSYQEVPPFIHLDLRHHHYYYRDELKATQFSKIVRKGSNWTANHEGIYDSVVLPLAKALESQRQDALKRVAGPGWRYVWLFFPIVALRDGLFGIDVSERPINPKAKGRIGFVRHLESGNVNGFYLIDFVTFDYLGSYIENDLDPFVKHVIELCNDKPSLFDKHDS
jgi:hypothetical protein